MPGELILEHPSTIAASSISSGIVSKNPFINHIARGRVNPDL